MNFCIRCGKEMAEGSTFCSYCGKNQLEGKVAQPQAPAQPRVQQEETRKKNKVPLYIGLGVLVLAVLGGGGFFLAKALQNKNDNHDVAVITTRYKRGDSGKEAGASSSARATLPVNTTVGGETTRAAETTRADGTTQADYTTTASMSTTTMAATTTAATTTAATTTAATTTAAPETTPEPATLPPLSQWDVVSFGRFYQADGLAAAQEPIEWVVLDYNDEEVVLLSRFILERQVWGASQGSYLKSGIRAWLNDDFYRAAFSSDEKEVILPITVTDHANPQYGSGSGESWEDWVTILSAHEVEKYFSAQNSRRCTGTDYALAQGLFVAENGYSPWWTRTMGRDKTLATLVRSDGTINLEGRVSSDAEISFGIRPVIIVKRSALYSIGR